MASASSGIAPPLPGENMLRWISRPLFEEIEADPELQRPEGW